MARISLSLARNAQIKNLFLPVPYFGNMEAIALSKNYVMYTVYLKKDGKSYKLPFGIITQS